VLTVTLFPLSALVHPTNVIIYPLYIRWISTAISVGSQPPQWKKIAEEVLTSRAPTQIAQHWKKVRRCSKLWPRSDAITDCCFAIIDCCYDLMQLLTAVMI
jgi:hypothetical protein